MRAISDSVRYFGDMLPYRKICFKPLIVGLFQHQHKEKGDKLFLTKFLCIEKGVLGLIAHIVLFPNKYS